MISTQTSSAVIHSRSFKPHMCWKVLKRAFSGLQQRPTLMDTFAFIQTFIYYYYYIVVLEV